MCGFVGYLGSPFANSDLFLRALDSIAHRGPDGEGKFFAEGIALGHRRLAIIDLTAGGHQPMVDAESGAVIVFNGELYNYRELRLELQSAGVGFRGESDTEVVLKAFLHWRHAAFGKFNGMWALAIWEPRARRLTLSRDRFGVKPLYYAQVSGRLLFASEPKAMLALDPSLAEADQQALQEFMVDSRSHAGGRGFFRRISTLPPACIGTWQPGQQELRLERFWNYPEPDTDLGQGVADPRQDAEEFGFLLRDAVRLRLRSDVAVGITLSGGLDSSAVLAASRDNGQLPTCFTSVFGESQTSEAGWAAIASSAVGARLELVTAAADDWAATLERITWHMDSPGYSPAVFPLWSIMEHARAHRTYVLMEGQGADEVLGGYAQHAVLAALGEAGKLLRAQGSMGAFRASIDGLHGLVPPGLALRWAARLLMEPLAHRIGPRRERSQMVRNPMASTADLGLPPAPSGQDALRLALHRDHSAQVLPALLHYGDSVSMAHGIESRLPFMDYRIVEWVFKRHPRLIVNGETKAPIRGYLRVSGMQEIAARKDKKGYETPVRDWLKQSTGRVLVEDMFADGGAPIWDILDRAMVRKLADRGLAHDDFAINHLYKVVTAHVWLRQLRDPDSMRRRYGKQPAKDWAFA